MELTDKSEFIIKLFCVIILISLNIAVYINGKDLNCNKCQIHFQSDSPEYKEAFNQPQQSFYVNITEIYNSYKEDYCLIKWSQRGYIYDLTKN